jgi:nitrite reductase (NADH) large subunit
MTQYIIIGNGVAANSAAESIRKTDPKSQILMFTKEKYYFYYIPALPEYLSGTRDAKTIIIHDEKWYRDNSIDLYLDTEITEVDPISKTVSTRQNRTFKYDRLLLATGGYSFVPPIKGVNNEGVFSLRTLDDANKIKEKASSSKELVLIGGGILGLEAGNGLRKAGLKVAVVEFFPRLLPRQMDSAGASILQKQMEDMGFSFFLNAKTEEISKERGRLSVNLESGEKIGTDMVLVSAGVRPEVSLAKKLGLDIDKGVKVDDFMKTGIEDIYAAGDLIEHRERFYGIWPASIEQGKIAGSNMAGKEKQYNGTVLANTLIVVGIDLTAAGDIDADEKLESIIIKDQDKKIYKKFVIKNNILEGAILLGDIRGSDNVLNAIKTRKDISSIKSDLGRMDFDFSLLK